MIRIRKQNFYFELSESTALKQLETEIEGNRLVNEGQYIKAERIFRSSLEPGSEHVGLQYNLARSLDAQFKISEAEKALTQAAEIDSMNYDVFQQLRQISNYNRQYDKGKLYIEKLTALRGDAMNTMNRTRFLAELERSCGNYQSAEKILLEALSREPDSREFNTGIAYVYNDRKQYDKALPYAEKAVSSARPDHFRANNLLAWLLVAGESDIDRGLAIVNRLLRSDFDYRFYSKINRHVPVPEHTMGLAYLKKEEYRKAVEYLTQAVEIAPDRQSIKENLQIAKKKAAEF